MINPSSVIYCFLLLHYVTLARCENCSSLPFSLYSPLNQTGPTLTVSTEQLASALKCFAYGNETDRYRWILLIPGTSENIEELFGWNWISVFQLLRWPYCTLQLPERGMTDLQIAAEYVVYALRSIFHQAKNQRQVDCRWKSKIDVIGHSLGGVLPRFAFRFWPDTRDFVRHLIAFSPTNHGTWTANTACSLTACPPSLHQQRFHSHFLCALNSYTETFPTISYTNILTRWDEIVLPSRSSELNEDAHVRNLYIQDWCPMRLFSEHLAVGTYDYCAYVLTIRTLQSQSLENISNCCEQTLMPGITIGFTEVLQRFLSIVAENARIIVEYQHKITHEPELRCAFRMDCIRTSRYANNTNR